MVLPKGKPQTIWVSNKAYCVRVMFFQSFSTTEHHKKNTRHKWTHTHTHTWKNYKRKHQTSNVTLKTNQTENTENTVKSHFFVIFNSFLIKGAIYSRRYRCITVKQIQYIYIAIWVLYFSKNIFSKMFLLLKVVLGVSTRDVLQTPHRGSGRTPQSFLTIWVSIEIWRF